MCKDCPPGSYTCNHGQIECTECAAGYYQDNATSVECVQCRPGTYQVRPSLNLDCKN